MKKLTKISFYFPTYNERENILKVIPMIINTIKKADFDYEIIIVDDNSPDRTADAVMKKFKKDRKVRVIKRLKERGYATAVRKGIESASGDWIGSFDADYIGPSTPFDLIMQMIKEKKGNFFVASRYLGPTSGMYSNTRNIASHLFSLFLKLLGYPLSDNTSGYYVINRKLLEGLDFDRIFYGYGDCFFRMVYSIKNKGMILREVPVFYPKRTYGETKTKFITGTFKYFYEAVKFRLNS